jgi:hypothetical protein
MSSCAADNKWSRLVFFLLVVVGFPAFAQEGKPPAPTATETKESLPWEGARKPPKLPGRQLQNAKELLELLGVDASQWNNFFHDQPLSESDQEWIIRILYHLPRLGGEHLHQWRKTDWKYDDVVAEPAKWQGEILHLEGRIKHLQTITLLPEVADRYGFDRYYQATLTLANGQTAIVCTRTITKAWEDRTELDERVEADALFLKTSPQADRPTELVLAAPRIAWLPDQVDAEQKLTSDAVFLAEHGFDHGLWDQLAGRQMHRLGDADREPFYALLAAMRDVKPSDPAWQTAPNIDIAKVLPSPASFTGSLMTVDGAVRRIDKVEVTDADIQARYGLDHYYILYVFVPLENQTIRWARDRNDPNPRVFENNFPVTVCVPQLPSGLKPDPNVHEHVRIPGAFYRIWTYKPQGPADTLPQPSPLVIGPTASIVVTQQKVSPATNIALGLVFVALIGITWFVVWRFTRNDNAFRKEVLQKKIYGQESVNLDAVIRDDSDAPSGHQDK